MLREVYEALLDEKKTISGAKPYMRSVQYSIYQLALMKNNSAYPIDFLDFHLNFVKGYGINFTTKKFL